MFRIVAISAGLCALCAAGGLALSLGHDRLTTAAPAPTAAPQVTVARQTVSRQTDARETLAHPTVPREAAAAPATPAAPIARAEAPLTAAPLAEAPAPLSLPVAQPVALTPAAAEPLPTIAAPAIAPPSPAPATQTARADSPLAPLASLRPRARTPEAAAPQNVPRPQPRPTTLAAAPPAASAWVPADWALDAVTPVMRAEPLPNARPGAPATTPGYLIGVYR